MFRSATNDKGCKRRGGGSGITPVPEPFKAFTPKFTLKIRVLIWVKCYIGVRFVVNNGILVGSYL